MVANDWQLGDRVVGHFQLEILKDRFDIRVHSLAV